MKKILRLTLVLFIIINSHAINSHLENTIDIFINNNLKYIESFGEIDQEIVFPAFILLHGPSGVGKTTFAYNLAEKIDAQLIEISGPSVVKKYIGDGSQTIKDAFENANSYTQKGHRTLILIDEIDAFAGRELHNNNQDSEWGAATQELQRQLDKCNKCCTIVVATTNYISRINKPLLLRMTCINKIKLPDNNQREEIIKYYLEKLNINLNTKDLKILVEKSKNLSTRDIKQAILLATNLDKTTEQFIKSFNDIYQMKYNNLTLAEKLKELNKKYGPAIQFGNNLQQGGKLVISGITFAFITYKYLKNV